jgi:hypothetical protein
MELGITHIVSNGLPSKGMTDKFAVLEISPENCFKAAPRILDFVRLAVLLRGRILFLESEGSNVMKEVLLIVLTHLFKTSTYETYTLIKSQNLNFSVDIT